MSWDKSNYHKQGYFYIDDKPWTGEGDLLYNTCRMIIETNDTSEWAWKALSEVFYCLEMRIRWPDYMDEYITATNKKQKDVSRDPYLLFYCACLHLGCRIWINWLKPPMKLYRPKMWSWRRYLINQTKTNLRIYKFWKAVSPTSKQEYVQVLNRYMDWAITKI